MHEECIIPNLNNKNQALLPLKPTFWLHFAMQGFGVEWQDFNLPIPNIIEYTESGYRIGWQIDGYFATQKGIEHLNDVIGRVLVTFNENSPHRLPYKPDLQTADHYFPKIRKLSALANLHSRPSRAKAPARADSYADYAFWAIKLYVEDRIREQSEGSIIAYELIEDWALSQFESKERSTIRAKCRSIWNWYDNRDWELPKDRRSFEMSRTENMKKVNANKKAKTRAAIKSVLEDMFVREQIRTKSGKIKATEVAKILEINRKTVSEHLKEMNLI